MVQSPHHSVFVRSASWSCHLLAGWPLLYEPVHRKKNEYDRAGFDPCVAFLLMRAVLAVASLKGNSDRIGLPDVGTTSGRVSFRRFRNRTATTGKLELCQDLARLSAMKSGSYQPDVLLSSFFQPVLHWRRCRQRSMP